MQQILETITPSQSGLDIKKDKCHALEFIVRRILPNAKLKIMGGTANTFALKNSDVDACIFDANRNGEFSAWELNELDNAFKRAGTNLPSDCFSHRFE